MRKILYFLILLFILPFLPSCSGHEARIRMDMADSVMNRDPDSALVILRSIPERAHARGEISARYNMLLTEARYKADSLPLDDSIIRISVDYYEIHEDGHNAARARYLAGITDYTNDRYSPALVNFLRAEKFAEQSTDTMLCGLIYRSIGDSYNRFYEVNTALEYHKKAYDFFKKAQATNYADYQLIEIASLYIDLRNFPKAIQYAELAEKRANETNDSNILFLSQVAKGNAYLRSNEKEKAIPIYLNISTSNPNFTENNYMSLGQVYLLMGDTTAAMECNSHITTIEPGVNAILINKLINEKKYKEALKIMLTTYDIIDSVTYSIWTRNNIGVINEYYKNEDTKSSITIQSEKRKKTGLGIIFSLLILLIIAVYIIRISYLKKKLISSLLEANILKQEINKQKEVNKTFYSELEKNLEKISHLEKERNELSEKNIDMIKSLDNSENNVIESRLRLMAMREEATSLIASRFTLIDDLLSEYYSYRDTKIEKEKLYAKVKKALDDFISDPDMIDTIEKKIDLNLDNLIHKFKKDFSNLSISNIQLYIYMVLNFSPRTIAILQNTTPETVYSRKSKLKNRIRKSGFDNSELYLSYISE